MLSRAILLLVGAATLLGPTAGCTGLTKPEQISIIAEPPPEPKAAQAPPGAAQRSAPQPAPQPEQAPGCGE